MHSLLCKHTNWLFLQPIKEPAGNGSPWWPCPHGLVFYFFPLVLLILSCVLTDDEKALCTQDIWNGERWRTSGPTLGPRKLTCQKERERETHFSFVFNKFALTWETLASGDDFCDLSPSTDLVSQTLADRSGRNRRSKKPPIKGGPSGQRFTVICRPSSANERPLCDLDSRWKLSLFSCTFWPQAKILTCPLRCRLTRVI